ncbi:hypothetical protein, partial [Nonomuraea antimicrobica]
PAPAPRHGVTEPDEGSTWRRELLEAIEAAAVLPLDTTAPGQEDDDPPHAQQEHPDSEPGTQEEDALTEPLEVVTPTESLESLVDTGPFERIVIPPATTPFDAFTPHDDDEDEDDAEDEDEDGTAEGTPPPAPDGV